MAEDSIRSAIDAIGRRVQEELEEHLSALTQRHREEVEATRRAAEADAEQQWSARVEAVRNEWTARLESEVSTVRAESERRMVAESMRLRVEAEQAAAESAAESAARVREELDRLLEEERERAASRLASERQQLFSAREQVQRDLQNAHLQIEALRQEVEGLLTARRNAESAADDARGARDSLTRQIEQGEAALAEERRTRDEIAEQLQRAEAALGEERRSREDLAGRHEQAEAGLSEERRTREELARQREDLARQQEDLAGQIQRAEAALADERRAREDATRQLQDASSSADAARVAERQGRLAIVERLLAGLRSMDSARSLSDVLAALLAAATAEAPRVALFVVNGTELRTWKSTGFAAETPNVSAAEGGLLADVLHRGEPVVTADGAGPAAPAFAALPHECAAIAVPLLVGAQPVAVLYADDATHEVRENPASWPEAVQILSRHASVNLAHLTAARAADAMRRSMPSNTTANAPTAAAASEDGNSARRYARLLVSEIKLYNEAAVRQGRQQRDLLARLKPEIDRARRLYEQRISSSVDSRGALFHQELVQTLADGDPALLGKPA